MFKRLEVILVVICLFITFGIYVGGMRMNQTLATTEFHRIAYDGIQALQTRMNIYLQSLNGAAGMMKTTEEIEVDDFEIFVQNLDLKEYLPGINGIGFIQPVPLGQEQTFVDQMHEKGILDFSVRPKTASAEKYIIKYIAPVGPNKQAVGLDITFEEGRREAANRSRATGLPQLTPRILLVQDETKQAGFLLLRPLYSGAGLLEGDFIGWVYAPFVGRNLMQDLTSGQTKTYNFSVYDGDKPDPGQLIYASDVDVENSGKYTSQHTMNFFGRPWTITQQSTIVFDALFPGRAPFFLLLAGILMTAMLAIALRALRLRGDSMAEVAALRGQQICAREEENRSIVENAVVAVIILDENRDVLFANHAAVDCFGYQQNGMGGLSFGELVTEIQNAPDTTVYNAVGKSLSGNELFLDLQQNDWVTLHGVRRVTAIVRDITAEVRAVQEVAATKQRYDIALAGSQIGVFEVNLVTGKSVVSQTWRDIMGVKDTEDDTQGVFLNRVHPDDLPQLFEADRLCIIGEADRSLCEYRMKFEESWRWMRSDAVIVERSQSGEAIRMIGTQTDVTHLRHARFAFEASENRFRNVLEAAPVGMAIMDSEGQFTSVNTAMSTFTGYSKEEMLDAFTLMAIVPADDFARIRKALSKSTKQRYHEVYREEHPIRHKDGGMRWGLFNITWTFDENAESHVYIAQVNDITDKKHMDQIKSEFVSTVSHELRTPLTSIKGALGLIDLSAKENLPAPVLRLVDIARANANRLTDIVNDILDLEKISSGEISFDLVQLELVSVVEDALQEMMPYAVTHKSKLVSDCPDTRVYVTADRLRTMQVLANLISNACKYSTEDTDVRVKVETLEAMAIVYVQNVGSGVPESFKGRIFEAFSQADGSDTRAKGGTGLGLNITRQIVWRQGGDIGFKSKPGGATVFWFTCPIAIDAIQPVLEYLPTARIASGPRLKVLHIEDDEDFAEVIRGGLSPFADVQNVTRLANASGALEVGPFDVIILDWTLPDGDASCLLEEIFTMQPAARVISLTSDGVRKHDTRMAAHLVKSQTEMSHIINCVIGLSPKGGDANLLLEKN